jgi:hypothetical protein
MELGDCGLEIVDWGFWKFGSLGTPSLQTAPPIDPEEKPINFRKMFRHGVEKEIGNWIFDIEDCMPAALGHGRIL